MAEEAERRTASRVLKEENMDNDKTEVIQATPSITPDGDRIFQRMTGKKQTLADLGLLKFTGVYVDEGIHHTRVSLIQHGTLDKILNILEDEALG
jgi:hypothetical protein